MHRFEALVTYAGRQEAHCTTFARAVLDRADRAELLDRSGPTTQEVIEYLETGLVERDFREMF